MSLQELKIDDTYSSDSGNLVDIFFNPVLARASTYDRVSGFFSPRVLALASRGFASIVKNHGHIRLVMSVEVDREVYDLIDKDSRNFDEQQFERLNFDVDALERAIDRDYLAVFAWLYSSGMLEMKVALTSKGRGILHQKVGIVTDCDGKSVSFSGSNNETVYGWLYNIEEFKVFKNWRIASASYYASDRARFDKLWSNSMDGVKVLDIDKAVKENIVHRTSLNEDISVTISRLSDRETCNDEKIVESKVAPTKPRELFKYQEDAIRHWFNHDYRSIFEMATGTGKTFTSISALKRFRDKEGYLRAVVVVPLTTLTVQWQDDLREIIDDVQIINTSTDDGWRDSVQSLYLSARLGKSHDYVIVTTYSMFPEHDFSDSIDRLGEDHVLVTDEMHNLVTERCTHAAKGAAYRYRLGLSATPTRLWKPSESAEVAQIFGDNRFTYDIVEAIQNKFLVPFRYHPLVVQLDDDEYSDYFNLSQQIGHLFAASKNTQEMNESLKGKLIARSRIKKNAESKVPALEAMVSELLASGKMHHALIYVDNQKFLQRLQLMLTRNHITSTKFIGSTPLRRRLSIIDNLRTGAISAIVAIKCLDEGVDIPSACMAFFMSNNTDPREYVQRLGRVLRVDHGGEKDSADIYDYLVMPPRITRYSDETERAVARNLIKGELIRAKFFYSLALNGQYARSRVADIVDGYGFYFEDGELEYNLEERE